MKPKTSFGTCELFALEDLVTHCQGLANDTQVASRSMSEHHSERRTHASDGDKIADVVTNKCGPTSFHRSPMNHTLCKDGDFTGKNKRNIDMLSVSGIMGYRNFKGTQLGKQCALPSVNSTLQHFPSRFH